MKQLYFFNRGRKFKRFDKKTAIRAYKAGLSVLITPCNCGPFNMWDVAFILNRRSSAAQPYDEYGVKKDFESRVASFEYYNCKGELGRYAAYYMPVNQATEPEVYDYSFLGHENEY